METQTLSEIENEYKLVYYETLKIIEILSVGKIKELITYWYELNNFLEHNDCILNLDQISGGGLFCRIIHLCVESYNKDLISYNCNGIPGTISKRMNEKAKFLRDT
jgi:hypothetical protein